jgi:hypothetical protein
MLSTEEVELLYRLAREEYFGQGTIVDCGPFLGGSTVALCAGLKDNPGRFPKSGRVHAYDRFLYEPYFERWFRPDEF